MKTRLPLVAGVLAVSLALPAAAQAGERPTPTDVRQHVRVADRALDQVKTLVRSGADSAAQKALVRYRREMRAATQDASGVVGKANVADVERVLGYRFDRCALVLARIVDQAGSPAQIDIAKAIEDCLGSREEAIADLTALLDKVPEALKPAIARAIAVLSAGGEQIVGQITNVLGTGLIPPQVGEVLKQALELAVGAIDMAVDRLKAISGLVPELVRPILDQALTLVQTQLHQVIGMVTDLIGGLLGNAGGGDYQPSLPFKLPIELPFSIPGFGFAVP